MADQQFSAIVNQVDMDEVFNSYYPRLVLFAIKLTGSKEESEEIVQDVFVRLWMKEDSLSINCSIKSFLFRSVFNASLDYLRRATVSKRRSRQLGMVLEEVVQFHDPIMEEELDMAINYAISQLPGQCERIFRLKKQEGLSYKEIAEKLNISERTVEFQVNKGVRYLKKKLDVISVIFP